MSPVLVLLCHPALERSRVNHTMVEVARGIEGVRVHDLYQAYPDLQVDVAHEQELLLGHEVVVFQHPFYWYSAPALLKEWQDLVLEHGWAYGRTGTHLRGKKLLNATTTGGPREAYDASGYNRFTMRQLLAPFEQTARLCGMAYLAPFVVHGGLAIKTSADAAEPARRYGEALRALRDGRVDWERASSASYLEEALC